MKIIEVECLNCGSEADPLCVHRELKYCGCLCHDKRYEAIRKMHIYYDENGDLVKR